MTFQGAVSVADLASPPASNGYLGVEKSLTGKFWLQRPLDERLALTLSQRLGVSEIIGRVLASRDIGLDDAKGFMEPTLRDHLPNPSLLKDMDVAAKRLAGAIMQDELIGIFGDYDVDGATSSSLLARMFKAVGGRSTTYIPDRIKEGYGPNGPALLAMRKSGVSIAVTVDCGTMSHEPLDIAKKAGLDVIVVDHHAAESDLPDAVAIVNPNRLDDESGQGHLAAVGVAFLLVVALNRVLREAGWYKIRKEPNLTQWLDIVALGTVCDVVALKGANRAFVRQGLKVMAQRQNPGLSALADVAGLDEQPGSFHLGFLMGPRVNAGGRIGLSELGTRLLATEDPAEAMEIAHRLDGFNAERKEIEAQVLQQAIDALEAENADRTTAFVAGKNWHPGVIGIVASRLKDRFNRPACVLSIDGDKAVGSGRSVVGVDLGAAVIAARQLGLIEKGGGHQMAAGFTVQLENLGIFRDFLDERIGERIAEAGIIPTLKIDGALSAGGVSLHLIHELEKLQPYGSGNAEPRFIIPNARIASADVAGMDHLRFSLDNPGGYQTRGIAFRCMGSPLGDALLNHNGKPFHLVGRVKINRWQGRSYPQFQLDDAAPVW
ncbi:MAG: single-stranded-DNA-specific exonuclease RecJ [Rhodospirillales bacterium]|nr:single-stranded-DNA-specific exonuclease RecJ [Rhodospirillales bacterium]